jgi:hypothetical protein
VPTNKFPNQRFRCFFARLSKCGVPFESETALKDRVVTSDEQCEHYTDIENNCKYFLGTNLKCRHPRNKLVFINKPGKTKPRTMFGVQCVGRAQLRPSHGRDSVAAAFLAPTVNRFAVVEINPLFDVPFLPDGREIGRLGGGRIRVAVVDVRDIRRSCLGCPDHSVGRHTSCRQRHHLFDRSCPGHIGFRHHLAGLVIIVEQRGRGGRHRVGRILALPDRVEHLASFLVLELNLSRGRTGRDAHHGQQSNHCFQLDH